MKDKSFGIRNNLNGRVKTLDDTDKLSSLQWASRAAGASLFVLASAGANVAQAQSSVTIYGIVDSGFTYTSNQGGKSLVQATAGNQQGSRWGFKGTEDLGGGLSAIFRLENGFDTDSGALKQGGRLFGRGAWVGLNSDRWGSVTAGRQFNPVQDYLSNDGVGAYTQYGNILYDNDDLNNTFRSDNSIKYTSPRINGLQAEALYAFSNSPGAADNRSWSVGAQYLNGPLRIDAAYALLSKPGLNTTGAIPSDNYFPTSVVSNVQRQQIWGVGGAYTVGSLSVALLHTQSNFSLVGNSLDFSNYEASAQYWATPVWQLGVGYDFTTVHQSVGGNAKYHQIGGNVSYYLSKRTDLYLNVIYMHGSGGAAWINGLSNPSSTGVQTTAIAGILHKF
ncbi:porin [Burkholderia cepacia]|uniref:porin n=1 Tax=Burkholderia cepacia TaxID=292 RepID=UPI0009C0CFC5|nr:porin [Burkholderia cepacia]